MRQSVASRPTQNGVSSAAARAKLLEKKKEIEAVAALEKASADIIRRIDHLGDEFEVIADTGIGSHLVWSE